MTDPVRGPGGRPTKYDPEYCEQAIAFMSQGYSITAFAGSIQVSRQTVYQWAEDHIEFSDALNVARSASALWWENRLRDVAEKNEGNATAAIFGLKNRAADEWRDKQQHEHSGPDGAAIQTEDVTKRDADAFTRAVAGLAPESGEGQKAGSTDSGSEGSA